MVPKWFLSEVVPDVKDDDDDHHFHMLVE